MWQQGDSGAASGSSRLAYFESEQPSGYTSSKSGAGKKEEPKPEILFSEEGFRLKRKPEAEGAPKKKEESRFASSKAISSDDVIFFSKFVSEFSL